MPVVKGTIIFSETGKYTSLEVHRQTDPLTDELDLTIYHKDNSGYVFHLNKKKALELAKIIMEQFPNCQ